MKKLTVLAALLAGCAPDPEIARLQRLLDQVRLENVELRRLAPTEQPAIAKELDAAVQKNRELRAEIDALRASLATANSQIPNEFIPLAAMLQDLRTRLTALEAAASRKGHTHQYKDSDGTIFPRTTASDK